MALPIAARNQASGEKNLSAGFAILLVAVVIFLVAPILTTASVSFTSERFMTFPPPGWSLRWYRQIFIDTNWHLAFVDTIVIGAICACVATIIGTLSAYGISRIRNASVRNALLILFLSPLVVPFVSFGMAVYPVFATYRLIGTCFGVALAQSIVSIPFVVLAVFSCIRPRDRVLENAARSLGASPAQAFTYVTLPLLKPGVFAGAVLSFMTSFDDVIMPTFLGGANVTTVPKAMLDALSMSGDPSVMAASTFISLIGLAGFVTIGILRRR
jgi:ABC-type spermidine/putrescine transport system permease subunit II